MKVPVDYILITSDEPAGKMYHTQLLFAEYLARENQVLYIDPPLAWNPLNLISLPKKKHGLPFKVYRYWNRFPSLSGFFTKQNERLNEKNILSALDIKSGSRLLIWHFDSYRTLLNGKEFLKNLTVKRVYHVIDPFYANPADQKLRELADLILVTSPRIIPFYSSHRSKVMQVPQVLDVHAHRLLLAGSLPPSFNINTPYAVLLGTFSEDIDYDWLEAFAAIKYLRLVLIGRLISGNNNATRFKQLTAQPQVEYLGEMEPRDFYPVLKNATVGLVVYNDRRRKGICSPLKALNYLLASKPVITNIDCEIPELAGEAIYYANDKTEFLEILKKAPQLLFNKQKVERYLEAVSIEKNLAMILTKLN